MAKHVGRNARALPSLTTPLLRQLAHHHHNAHRGVPGRSHQGDGRTEESQAQPNTPMNPSDLLAETVFGKRASSKKHHPAGPHFGVQNLAPSGGPYKKKWIRGPRFGVRNLDPKTGSDQRSFFPTFLGVSACAFNALRRGQACWSKRSRVTFFDDAPSEATCAPPSQRAQGRPLSARPDFGPDFGPYFWVLPSDSFFPAEGLQACERFPHIGFQG